jgi:hypothetical protein
LDRYEIEPDGADPKRLVVGGRVPGVASHTLRAPLQRITGGGGTIAYAPADCPTVSVEAASSAAPNALVSVCAGLVGEDDGAVRLCEGVRSQDGCGASDSRHSESPGATDSTSSCMRFGPRVLDASTYAHSWGKAAGSHATSPAPFVAGPLLLRVAPAGGFTGAIVLSTAFP